LISCNPDFVLAKSGLQILWGKCRHDTVLNRRLPSNRLVPRRLVRLFLDNRVDATRQAWLEHPDAPLPQPLDGAHAGTAFFASTSLIALGGALTLFHTEEMLTAVARLPFGETPNHTQWELKVIGLMIIFVYAFFKFAWAYRLYNYVAIMVGGAPPAAEQDTPEAKTYAETTATIITEAGRHFNRGQRAFSFALGYLGWFLGPLPLIATTAGILAVQWRRQFSSESCQAVRNADT
jgi:uncharacterized membrane protein